MGLGIAGAILGGSLISGAASYLSGRQAGRDAESASAAQVAWERERALNAHQWEVEDLKKAGLNPILSAGGNGAVTGGISAPMPDRSGYVEAGRALSSGITTALDAKRVENETTQLSATLDKLKAEINETNARTGFLDQQTITELAKRSLMSRQEASEVSRQALNYSSAQKMDTETKIAKEKLGLEIGNLKAQIEYLKENKKYKEADALLKQYENKMKGLTYWFDKGERAANIMFQGVNSAANVVRAANPL